MLCRETGKIIHIDFGDCFEVAMMREKYPEKVPFRLTRMLVAAMEVTGIDGTYRHTCETVMQLMRTNRDSLLAVLEAFIHDPLLQWVLLDTKKPTLAGNGQAPGSIVLQQQGQQVQQQQPNGGGKFVSGQQVLPEAAAARHSQQQSARAAPQQQGAAGGRNPTNSIIPYVFTDPNYPSSLSLRDCRHINPWRHHLCNGPWLGCYETGRYSICCLLPAAIFDMKKHVRGLLVVETVYCSY